MRYFVLTLIILSFFRGTAQPKVEMLHSGNRISLRGLSVVNNDVLWVSGTSGTVGKSVNGGKDWKWTQVKGFEKTDFRDIEAFNANTAVIIGVGEPAYILKTTDGGETWTVVYENKAKGMFLDAMEFRNDRSGVVIGDPINGRVFIAETGDGGSSWTELPQISRPLADSGEAFFAASGTNIRALNRDEWAFVSGGLSSHLFKGSSKTRLPLLQGKETTGANSIAVYRKNEQKKARHMIVVGGDFAADTSARLNCFYSDNGGKTWKAPKIGPHGYRSSVEYLTKKKLLSCGTKGVDYSTDGGKRWSLISTDGFHVCRKAKNGDAVFLAGGNGRIARLVN